MEGSLLIEFIIESLKENNLPLSSINLEQLEEIWEKIYNNKHFQTIKFLDKGKGVMGPFFIREL